MGKHVNQVTVRLVEGVTGRRKEISKQLRAKLKEGPNLFGTCPAYALFSRWRRNWRGAPNRPDRPNECDPGAGACWINRELSGFVTSVPGNPFLTAQSNISSFNRINTICLNLYQISRFICQAMLCKVKSVSNFLLEIE